MNNSRKFLQNVLRGTALLMAMLFSFTETSGQIADTLREVKIRAKRNKPKASNEERLNTYSPGQTIVTIDSVTLQQYKFQNMANLLSQQVPVFVKSYGLNNIATLNFRGASAAQSQVYWNGVPIQNAALGIADVSLLPVSLINKVNVVYGSSSAMWGSGNVGGALLIENDLPAFDDSGSFTQSVSAVAASYGHYQAGVKSALATKRFVLSVDAFGQSAKNNFPYEDNNGVEQRMNNVKLQSGVGMLQAGYKINDKQTITARAWYQQYYREIPRALFEAFSVKNQRDESLRTLLDWNRKGNKTSTYVKVAYIRDIVWYEDSTVLVNAKNFTNQLYAEAGVNHRFNEHHKLLLFSPVHISSIDRVSLGDRYEQQRYALAAAYLYSAFDNKLNISVNGRGELIDDVKILLPGINASYDVTDYLQLRANAQRTFRMPTLNELYYNPGGNPLLKPEKGWNEDAGYTLCVKRKLAVQHSLSAYNRVIDDWIIWFGGAIWTPHNIATVRSRGLQTENRFQYTLGSVTLHLSLNAAYTIATTMASYQPGDGSIGKQIPYTPLYNGQGNLGLTWKRLYVNYNHTYTGLRYITTDESYELPYYTIGNLQLMYSLTPGNNPLQITAQCNNIWSSGYQVVNARPMPGINLLFGLSFSFGG